jgi:hypothetical protein
MTDAELARRARILEEMDGAAYECTGALAVFVDLGKIKNVSAVAAVARFRAALAAYEAVNAIDTAAGRIQ